MMFFDHYVVVTRSSISIIPIKMRDYNNKLDQVFKYKMRKNGGF